MKSMTSPLIGDAPVVMSLTRPPSLALTLENTSASQNAPEMPPLVSPRASEAFFELHAASKSLLATALPCLTCPRTLSWILFHKRGTEQKMVGRSSKTSSRRFWTSPE